LVELVLLNKRQMSGGGACLHDHLQIMLTEFPNPKPHLYCLKAWYVIICQ